MLGSIRRTLRNLKLSTSGNATLLVAIGMPAMIGGSGLAVDTAQWYMWKRELQNAADQAALAGAWARTDTDTQAVYAARAAQEYAANVAVVADFDTLPAVSLAKHGTSSTLNSVLVTASASQELPFSSMLTGRTATVSVSAQATFDAGINHRVCMLALDPSADSAFRFGGSVTGSSVCGAGTLSDDPNAAMKEVGLTDVPLGKLVAAGGIDQGFEDNGTIYQNQSGLSDPYASLATPSTNGSSAQTYSCVAATAAYDSADITTRTIVTNRYYRRASGDLQPVPDYRGVFYQPNSDNNPGITLQDQVVTSVIGSDTTRSNGPHRLRSGSHEIWLVTEMRTIISYSDLRHHAASDGIARPLPGIYSSIAVTCPTEFSPGIYFVGDIDFGQNQVVTGSSVLFVMTASTGRVGINSNSVLRLSGISAATLTGAPYYFPTAYAEKLKGMLVFDKESANDFTMNGSASLHLDGVFYMPYRTANFLGNADAYNVDVPPECMMFATRKIDIQGNFNVSNFCVPDSVGDGINLGGGTPTVKLVA